MHPLPMSLPAELRNFSQADLDRAKAIGAIYRGAAVIVVHEAVLDEIIEYSEQGRRCEVGGFLLGGVYNDDPPFTVIRHFHPALQAVSGAASLTFTHDVWADLHRQAEQKYPGETVVGWHRRGWKLFWRWRSCAPFGRPRLSSEVRELIARTAAENPRWASDLADALGTTRGLLETWIRRGRVRAHQRDEPRRRWVIWADAAELARLRGLRERSVADEARRRWTEPPAELAAEYHSPAKE